MKTKCLVLNDREQIDEAVLDEFVEQIEAVWIQNPSKNFPLQEAFERHKDAQILITTYMPLTAKNLSLLPNLKSIITTTTATEYIDKDYCETNDITINNTTAYTGASVAEHAVAMMFCVSRKLIQINSKIRQGDFNCFDEIGIELNSKTAGIIGLGNIGTSLSKILSGIGLKVLYHNRTLKKSTCGIQVPLHELLNKSDFIFLTLPLNDSSVNLISDDAFSKMKSSAILISTSPDKIIEKKALIHALTNRTIAYAALDLHSQDEEYLNMPNALITPRRAWYTQECVDRRINTWKGILANVLETRFPIHA